MPDVIEKIATYCFEVIQWKFASSVHPNTFGKRTSSCTFVQNFMVEQNICDVISFTEFSYGIALDS
jgi:hypothetical protein